MLDDDGYPLDADLLRMTAWPMTSISDIRDLMAFAKERWRYDAWEEADVEDVGGQYHEYTISTYGWSGNESIIAALEANIMFMMIAPWSWRRGGHYVYRVPLEPPRGPGGER